MTSEGAIVYDSCETVNDLSLGEAEMVEYAYKLKGFLSIAGYCCIWIPGYRELAWPLYKFITETQQAQTNKLVWSPETQKAFKSPQTALLQVPTLSLPTGSEFTLFVTEKRLWHIA